MDFERVFAAAGNAREHAGHVPAAEVPLFPFERRIALRNRGRIDPTDINDYILRGQGYGGLARCLKMSPASVFAGMAGDERWRACAEAAGDEKYVVGNAVDADPLAQTARLLLESDPHAILEGLLIATYAVGASRCVIAVPDEYQAAVERLNTALAQMRDYSLLGNRILDSDFGVEVEIAQVKRALILDEETALLCVLEGRPPIPSPRTGAARYRDSPVLVESAETLARLPATINGDDKPAATKVITIAGQAAHRYTVEVPLDTTLRTLATVIGGDESVKAVQFGGPAGAFYDVSSLDTPIGGLTGSGTLKVIDAGSCAVEMARDAVAYLQEQSCGKCVFCREGTYQMSVILKDIAEGRGKPSDIDLLIELGEAMKTGSVCDLGSRAPDPVLSGIRLFRSEFDSHIADKRCAVRQG